MNGHDDGNSAAVPSSIEISGSGNVAAAASTAGGGGGGGSANSTYTLSKVQFVVTPPVTGATGGVSYDDLARGTSSSATTPKTRHKSNIALERRRHQQAGTSPVSSSATTPSTVGSSVPSPKAKASAKASSKERKSRGGGGGTGGRSRKQLDRHSDGNVSSSESDAYVSKQNSRNKDLKTQTSSKSALSADQLLSVKKMRVYGDQDLNPLPQEEKHIRERRAMFDSDRDRRTMGYCASGGGIRSAAFNCGILDALSDLTVERQCLLSKFDYISCVAGGGFTAGSFVTHLASQGEPRDSRDAGIRLRNAMHQTRHRMAAKSAYVSGQGQGCGRLILQYLKMFLIMFYILLSPLTYCIPIGTFLAPLVEATVGEYLRASLAGQESERFMWIRVGLGGVAVASGIFTILVKFCWRHRQGAPKVLTDFIAFLSVAALLFSLILADVLIISGADLLASWATVVCASLLIGFIAKPFFFRQFASLSGLKQTLIDFGALVFGPLLFVYYLTWPIYYVVTQHAFRIFFWEIFEFTDSNWSIWVTAVSAVVLIYTAFRLVVVAVTDEDSSLLSKFFRENIARAFFASGVDYKLPSLQLAFTPIILINLTLNDFELAGDWQNPEQTRAHEKISGDLYTVSPYTTGSRVTGFSETTQRHSLHDTLGISASLIEYRSNGALMRFFAHMFSLHLGRWVRFKNYSYCAGSFINLSHVVFLAAITASVWIDNAEVQQWIVLAAWVLQLAVVFITSSVPGSSNRYSPIMNSLSQMFTNTSAVKNRQRQPPPMGFLSDGGHLENLGMLAMFVRQAGLIVCGDGGADAKLDLDDLKTALHVAKAMGVVQKFEYEEDHMKRLESPDSRRIFIRIKVFYDEDLTKTGDILYIKLKRKPEKGSKSDKSGKDKSSKGRPVLKPPQPQRLGTHSKASTKSVASAEKRPSVQHRRSTKNKLEVIGANSQRDHSHRDRDREREAKTADKDEKAASADTHSDVSKNSKKQLLEDADEGISSAPRPLRSNTLTVSMHTNSNKTTPEPSKGSSVTFHSSVSTPRKDGEKDAKYDFEPSGDDATSDQMSDDLVDFDTYMLDMDFITGLSATNEQHEDLKGKEFDEKPDEGWSSQEEDYADDEESYIDVKYGSSGNLRKSRTSSSKAKSSSSKRGGGGGPSSVWGCCEEQFPYHNTQNQFFSKQLFNRYADLGARYLKEAYTHPDCDALFDDINDVVNKA